MAVYVDMAAAQFENTNELRMYPFSDGASLKDRIGRELPRDIVVDVHMVVPCQVSNPSSGKEDLPAPVVRLSSVHISESMVSACFVSELAGESGKAISAVSVSVAADRFRPFQPYMMEKLAGSSDIGGIVTFGNVDFRGFPDTYFLDGAVLHPCCISYARPAALRSFVDLRNKTSARGDVEIGFSGYVDAERSGNSYRLSLQDGAAEALMSSCAVSTGDDACGATPITSINGIRPDADGNIVLWFH